MNVERPKKRKFHDPYVLSLHKAADAPRKLAEERAKNPVFRGRPKDTTRESSIEFYKKWH